MSGRAALTKEESRLIGRSVGHDLVYVVGENVSLSSAEASAESALIGSRGEEHPPSAQANRKVHGILRVRQTRISARHFAIPAE